jgi:type VII secretion integral membrane protein EccD
VAKVDEAVMSRVTIVSPTSRVDLALPADVPIAHLLPTLARYAMAGVKAVSSRDPWTLARLGAAPFNPERTLGQAQVRDGDILYLRQRESGAPEAVFDDVVEAIATAQQQSGAWTPRIGRAWAVVAGTAAAIAGAVFVPLAGLTPVAAGASAAVVAAVLLLIAVAASRLGARPVSTLTLALCAVAYTAAGGLAITADPLAPTRLGARQLVLAAVAAMLLAGLGATVMPANAPALLAVSASALVLLAATEAHLTLHVSTATVAAVATTVAIALLPTLPITAFRLARLPMPQVPDSPQDVLAEHEAIDPNATLARGDRAAAILAAMIGGYALVVTGAGLTLALTSRTGLALAAVATALMWLRARSFVLVSQRLPLVIAGIAGIAILVGGCAHWLSGTPRTGAVLGLLAVTAAGAFAFAARPTTARAAPTWGRFAEVAETLLTVAVVPVAAWVAGVFALMK